MKWGLYTILPIAIISFVFLGTNLDFSGGGFQNPEFVTVKSANGEERILRSEELRQAEQDLIQDIGFAAFMSQRQPPSNQMMRQVSNSLTLREKAEQAVANEGLREIFLESGLMTSKETVEASLNDQNITPTQFQNLANQFGGSTAAVRFLQKDQEIRRGEQIVNLTARASLLESWQTYKQLEDQLEARYIVIPVQPLEVNIDVSDAEVQEYFEENQADFVKAEERVYRYVKMAAPIKPAPISSSAQELLDVYESTDKASDPEFEAPVGKNVRHILLKIDEQNTTETLVSQLSQVRELILAGADFAEQADILSADDANLQFDMNRSTTKGGLLSSPFDNSSRSRYETRYGQEWAEAVGNMSDQDLSEPVVSNDAVYLIKVDGMTDGIKTFEEAMPILRERLRQEKEANRQILVDERLAKIDAAEQEFKNVLAKSTSLSGIGTELNLDVETTSPTRTLSNFVVGIGSITPFREVILDLEEGQLSPVLRLPNTDDLVILQVSEVLEERPNTLNEVENQVSRLIRTQKASDKAREIGQEILEASKMAEGGLDGALQSLSYNYEVTETAEPFTRIAPPTELQGIANLENVTFRSNVGDIVLLEKSFFSTTASDIIVFELTGKQEPSLQDFLENLSNVDQTLTQQKAQSFVVELEKDTEKTLNPEYNEELLVEQRRSERAGRRFGRE